MRLSGLVVASILLIPPALLAQHSSAGSSSSGGSSSHASGPSSGTSHASSGPASSGAIALHSNSGATVHSSSSHAAPGGGNSANNHHPLSSSHNTKAGTVEARASISRLPSGSDPSRSDAERTIHEPVANGLKTVDKGASNVKAERPEKRGVFSFLRHPLRKPEPRPKAKLKPEPHPEPKPEPERHVVCKHEPCRICPPGQSGKKGRCETNSAQPVMASNQCSPNESWNGNSCEAGRHCQPWESWDGARCVNSAQCATFMSRADSLAAEARGVNAQAACSQNPTGQQCMSLTQSHDETLQRYRMLFNEAPASCRTQLPDPATL
jgi:hypothetical protein